MRDTVRPCACASSTTRAGSSRFARAHISRSTSGDTAWGELASWTRSLGDVSWTTVLVGAAALAIILGLRFLAPRVPGALVLVVGGLLAT